MLGGQPTLLVSLQWLPVHEYERTDEILSAHRVPGQGQTQQASSRATATKKHTLCADLTNQDTRAREFRALAEASAEHPRAVQRVMVLERDALARLNTPHVEVLPGYEWLLEPANK